MQAAGNLPHEGDGHSRRPAAISRRWRPRRGLRRRHEQGYTHRQGHANLDCNWYRLLLVVRAAAAAVFRAACAHAVVGFRQILQYRTRGGAAQRGCLRYYQHKSVKKQKQKMSRTSGGLQNGCFGRGAVRPRWQSGCTDTRGVCGGTIYKAFFGSRAVR